MPRLNMPLWMHKKGFSLFECMIVITIIMSVLALTRTSYFANDRLIVRAELHKLYTICQLLRMRALATNSQFVLSFDCINHSYAFDNTNEQLPPGVKFDCMSGALGPPASAEKLITQPSSFAHNKIVFYATGIVQPGTIYITNTKKTIMYALSNGVSQFSYVRMYVYEKNRWLPVEGYPG